MGVVKTTSSGARASCEAVISLVGTTLSYHDAISNLGGIVEALVLIIASYVV